MSPPFDRRELLTHVEWMRALATRLVKDSHLAEDLTQETMLSALRTEVDTRRPMRGWLATVLRHHRIQWARGEKAREKREHDVARDEALEPTLDVVEKAQVHRDLVDRLLALEEPYRTTLLMRFFDGLSYREIARRSQVALATVNSRVTRGLALLRQGLDRDHGDRRRWMVALLPWVERAPSRGVLLKSVVAIGVLGLAISVVVLRGDKQTTHQPLPHESPVTHKDQASKTTMPRVGRRALEAVERSPRTDTFVPRAGRIGGIVFDPQGKPLAGLEIVSDADGGRVGITDRSGRFEGQVPADAERLFVSDDAWVTVLSGWTRGGKDRPTVLVVAPRFLLKGRVVTALGESVREARLTLLLPRTLGLETDHILDDSLNLDFQWSGDSQGRFEDPRAPLVPGATWWVEAPGFRPREISNVPPNGVFVLESWPMESSIAGLVVDEAGDPLDGVFISDGNNVRQANSDGEFRIPVPEGTVLTFARKGRQPVSVEVATLMNERRVVLDRRCVSLHGRVEDERGLPVAEALVWLDDAQFFGAWEGQPVHLESILADGHPRLWSPIVADRRGEFAFQGLGNRDYAIRAVDPRTLANSELYHHHAGQSHAVLRMAPFDAVTHLEGFLVDRDGEPVANASVGLYHDGYTFKDSRGAALGSYIRGPRVTTDEHGAFEFGGRFDRGARLMAVGPDCLPGSLTLGSLLRWDEVALVVERRCHLQVVLKAEHSRADAVGVRGKNGEELPIRILRGEEQNSLHRAELNGGRTRWLAVGDRVRFVSLYRGDREVDRVPVQVHAGRRVVIEW